MEKITIKTVILILTLIILGTMATQPLSEAYAQPNEEWSKTYGTPGHDHGNSVQQTSDGGYIIAGHTSSFPPYDIDVYLVKTDSDGEEEWSKTYGGSDFEEGYSVQQTSDGGYIIAGTITPYYDYFTNPPEGSSIDVYLVKTDPNGEEEWIRTYGGTGYDYGESVQQTSDGGYIIAGHTWSFGVDYSDFYLIKTDSDGNELWSKTYEGSDFERAYSVQQTSDGGYILAGHTLPMFGYYPVPPELSNTDVYLVKTDPNGVEEWSKTYIGPYSFSFEGCYSVQQTSDGGYILAGNIGASQLDLYGIYLIKTDPNGEEEWIKTYGGENSENSRSIQQTLDGGYIIAGTIYSGYGDIYLFKINSDGDMLWQKTFGGTKGEVGQSVQQTSDGGYIIAGYTTSFGAGGLDVYLIKVEPETYEPYLLNQQAMSDLEAIKGELNEGGQVKLDEALYYLSESAFGEPGDDESLWLDSTHLHPDNGDDFFSVENDAVEKLMEILEKPQEYGVSETIVEQIHHIIIDRILKSEEILAQTVINEAVGGDPDLLDEANQEMQNAQNAIENGEYNKTVEHYFKAWEAALKSVGII